MFWPGIWTMVRVMLSNIFNNLSVVGLSIPFLGLFSIKPTYFSWFCLSLRRTTNSIKVKNRTALCCPSLAASIHPIIS